MRRRTLLTVVMIGLMVLISFLLLLMFILLREPDANTDAMADDSGTIEQAPARPIDKWAGKEDSAISLVQNTKIMVPSFVAQVVELQKFEAAEAALTEDEKKKRDKEREKEEKEKKKRDKDDPDEDEAIEPVVTLESLLANPPDNVAISSLVEEGYLEERLKMSFLTKLGWRAVHLDTDPEADDPFFEVYLEYVDEKVTIGAVWIVNLETKQMIPRNDLASLFEITPRNFDSVQKKINRPDEVVMCMTNNLFDSGIELGALLLLRFMEHYRELPKEDRQSCTSKEDCVASSGGTCYKTADRKEGTCSPDRIIGWTVNHLMRDEYEAYFQWVEDGEYKQAKWLYTRKGQGSSSDTCSDDSFEARGFLTFDLMFEGQAFKLQSEPVDIYPGFYDAEAALTDAMFPWSDDFKKTCETKEYGPLCSAIALVLKETDFVQAIQWLLTSDPVFVENFDACKKPYEEGEDPYCLWRPKDTESESVFDISYEYREPARNKTGTAAMRDGTPRTFKFEVDVLNLKIIPQDSITEWALWSVQPRT